MKTPTSVERAREVLPREDWQWLADQLRAWPNKRVHPERTMCDGALRPMAADVIEQALATLANEAAPAGEVIPMLCRKCKRTMDLPRLDAPDVPTWVVRIEHDQCDLCHDGDRSAEHWLAADGSEPDPSIGPIAALAPQTTPDVGVLVEAHAGLYPVTSEARQALLNLLAALNTVTNEGEER